MNRSVERRLTLVEAGPGFGKSTLLTQWAARRDDVVSVHLDPSCLSLSHFTARLASAFRAVVDSDLGSMFQGSFGRAAGPGADEVEIARTQAGLFTESLRAALDDARILVLDDVHEVFASESVVAFLETFTRSLPPSLHLVLGTRTSLPFSIDRLRGRGDVRILGAQELRFTPGEVKELAEGVTGRRLKEVDLEALIGWTGGWPAAVRLAFQVVPGGDLGDLPDRLASSRGPLYSYLAAEVFESVPAGTVEILRIATVVGPVYPELLEAMGVDDARRRLVEADDRGLFFQPRLHEDDPFILHQLVKESFSRWRGEDRFKDSVIAGRAARWFEQQGRVTQALDLLMRCEDKGHLAGFIERRGFLLLTQGLGERLLRAIELLPEGSRSSGPYLELAGAALQVLGRWDEAVGTYERARASEEGSFDAKFALGLATIHYLKGDLRDALAVADVAVADETDPATEALLLATRSSIHWRLGNADACAADAAASLAAAERSGNPRALSAAHTAVAMDAALRGDRRLNKMSYEKALSFAESAGDVLQQVRIRTNRASLFHEEGEYPAALQELGEAVALAESTGFAAFQILALSNRGQTNLSLGRLEEATADFETARAVSERVGSSEISNPLGGLGDVHRERGNLALARSYYEEAIEVAEPIEDLQSLVPALAGLASVLAPTDPAGARRAAERALASARGMERVMALIAMACVDLREGLRAEAVARAQEAAEEARARRDKPGLARALEIEGRATGGEPGVRLLREAEDLFERMGDELSANRTRMYRGIASGPQRGSATVAAAIERLADMGAHGLVTEGTLFLEEDARGDELTVRIVTLGGFRVIRDGSPVPTSEWGSKKARDLLKLLVARRGRAVAREMVMDVLWPDEEPEKLANRLSVALSTVRKFLDPEGRFGPDDLIEADNDSVRLVIERVEVDVDRFLVIAGRGLSGAPTADPAERLVDLRRAESLYGGDFLEEEPYSDWAIGLREEARATYLSVCHALAEAGRAAEDRDSVGRHYLRILEKDPYDERAHLGLIANLSAAGQHGEAHRRYRTYESLMADIDVEAAPFPTPVSN